MSLFDKKIKRNMKIFILDVAIKKSKSSISISKYLQNYFCLSVLVYSLFLDRHSSNYFTHLLKVEITNSLTYFTFFDSNFVLEKEKVLKKFSSTSIFIVRTHLKTHFSLSFLRNVNYKIIYQKISLKFHAF